VNIMKVNVRVPTPFILLLPLIVIFSFVLIYPWALGLYYSLLRYRPMYGLSTEFIGLENYISIIKDPVFYNALKVTGNFMLLAVAFEMILGLLLAEILDGIKHELLRKTAVVIILIPMMTATVYAALSWRLIFYPLFGVANYFLTLLGLPPQDWFGDPRWPIPVVAMVDIWQNTAFVTLVLFAGLQSLPTEWIEAARIDGASSWQIFRYIKIPFLRPLILIALFFRIIITLRVFESVMLIFSETGGPGMAAQVLGVYLYWLAFRIFDLGRAAALSWIMLLLTVGLSFILLIRFYKEVKM